MASENLAEQLLSDTSKEQSKIITYIFNNPESYDIIDKKYFTDSFIIQLYDFIVSLYDKKVEVTKELIVSLCKEKNVNFKEDTLSIYIQDKVESSTNILEYIRIVRESYIRKNLLANTTQVLSNIVSGQDIDYTKLQTLADNLVNTDSTLEETLLDFEQLTDKYESVLEKRRNGENKRTMGFNNLDSLLARPAAIGESTGIVALKMFGKSLLLKCIENSLMNQRICVLSVNLEMEAESNYDRLLAIREGIELKHLLHPDKNEESMDKKIKVSMERLKTIPNYLYYTEAQITLDELDMLIYKAKKEFKKRECLPEDEYIVVAIDSMDMVDDFANSKDSYAIKKAANKMHQINRKHKCHIVYLVQSNENVFRAGKSFTTPEACDAFRTQTEHVEGGATYAARSRVILSINRPLVLKRRYLSERKEEWDLEDDIMYVTVVKQNDGKLGECKFVFPDDSFRLVPFYLPENIPNNNERRRR